MTRLEGGAALCRWLNAANYRGPRDVVRKLGLRPPYTPEAVAPHIPDRYLRLGLDSLKNHPWWPTMAVQRMIRDREQAEKDRKPAPAPAPESVPEVQQ